MYNPALREEPRYEPAGVIPLKRTPSLLEWLAAVGHLIARHPEERVSRLEEELELSDLIGEDEGLYGEEEKDFGSADEN